MALLKVIEWADNSSNTIVYKIDTKKDIIKKGSALTVREGQVAIFCDKGRMADVFLPGYYKLETDSLPILTSLLSWKYGFESPFKSEVYFVNTARFAKQRWGTANPIMLRDPDFGAVRVRGYGTYSFRVKDAYVFMTELSWLPLHFQDGGHHRPHQKYARDGDLRRDGRERHFRGRYGGEPHGAFGRGQKIPR